MGLGGDVLELMLKDMETAPERFRPTHFWTHGVRRTLEDLRSHGFDTFRRHASALEYYVPHYGEVPFLQDRKPYMDVMANLAEENPGLVEAWLGRLSGAAEAHKDYCIFRAADTHRPPRLEHISEARCGMPLEQFEYGGRTYGCAMLRLLKALVFLKKTVKTEGIQSVLEIGGGFGSLGEILLKSDSADYLYVDVDIPPVAAVATHYLQAIFGPDAVADYVETRTWDVVDIEALKQKGFRAAVLCPWQLPRLQGAFQLFVNTSSFQEMEPDVVRVYAEHVDRLVDPYLLLRNSRHGKPVATSDESVGVREQVIRSHYLDAFRGYDCVAMDAEVFGQTTALGFASEVMIMVKRGSTLGGLHPR